MKKLNLLALILCAMMLSCIPSLHPIYTENSRILDDRILGHWVNEEVKAQMDKLDIKIEIESDSLDALIEKQTNLFGIDESGSWLFERAADIRYEKRDKNGSHSAITIDDQMAETHDMVLIEKGYKVVNIDLKPYYILQYTNLEDEEKTKETVKVNLTRINGELYMDFQTIPAIREASRFSINLIPAHTFAKLEFAGGDMYINSFDSEYIEKLIKNKRVSLKHEVVDGSIILTASTRELRAFIEKYGRDEKLYVDRERLVTL